MRHSDDQAVPRAQAFSKGTPVTEEERYLGKLCERSFLSLWSYPSVFRDQGSKNGGDGKEVADLLVVFGDDVIIFSDKAIAFSHAKDEAVAWARWHRRAVLEGAKQLWAAERWMRDYPERLFLDRRCTQRFPLPLPKPANARFHLVLVAHGATEACRKRFGGSGSLILAPLLQSESQVAFTVGDLEPTKSFVHILDDTSLDIVMAHCDTTADLVNYLTRKERFIRTGRLISAAGEEEMLAYFLTHTDSGGQHDFTFPEDVGGIVLDEGHYGEFAANPQLRAKKVADESSYLWDSLIEEFSKNVVQGTLYYSSSPEVSHHETGLRILASEPRVRRRMLSNALLEMAHDPRGHPVRRLRVISGPEGGTYYAFLCLKHPEDLSYEQYREVRRNLLLAYARTIRLLREDATEVVGIGLDFPSRAPSSEDLVVYDCREFGPEERAEAERAQRELNLLSEVKQFAAVEHEYPIQPKPAAPAFSAESLHRNAACPCGSGKKFRLCCRSRRQDFQGSRA